MQMLHFIIQNNPHLIQFLLLQGLADPFEPLFVRQLRPLFTKTVLDVFCGRLVETKRRSTSLGVVNYLTIKVDFGS